MSAAPSEPEKYSIDEMMDRLKVPAESPEDGELVTRSDGSQAIRVRKRKRRSNQPHKDGAKRSRRASIVQVSGALALLFLALLVAGGAIVYANSTPFRDNLVRNIHHSSGAKGELRQFRMNPKTANANNLALEWPTGNLLKSLTVRGLNAEIFASSFLGKSLNGEEVSGQEGTLQLRVPSPGDPLIESPPPGEAHPLRFNRYRLPVFHATLGDPAAPVIRLMKSEASLSPRNVNGRPQMSLYQGSLAVSGWPALRVDRALVELRGKEMDIIGLRLLHETEDRGAFELSGTVFPYQPERLSSLAVHLEAFDLSGITGPGFGRLLSGRIETSPAATSNYLSFKPTENPSPVLDVSFRKAPTAKFEFHGLPFLFALSQILDDEWFERPFFESDATGIIHREGGSTSIREINFESKGRLALRGEITLATAQTFSGKLDVGVAEAMVATAATERVKAMFGPPKEGFRWITLKISGPAANPTDNFKELFQAATVNKTEDPASSELRGSSFEDLTRPK